MARRNSRRDKKKQQNEGGQQRWLITYADLITLLMIFFVLMYTMSQVDAVKYKAVANSLSVVLTGDAMSMLDARGPSLADGLSGQQLPEGAEENPSLQGQLDEVKSMVEEFIRLQDQEASEKGQGEVATRLGDYIVIVEQERGLVISIKDTLLFASGSNELTPQAKMVISKVGEAVKPIPNYVRVEGHTDNLPIHTTRFPSNWELSVLRATNVVHILQDTAGINPERLSAIGYGEYRPLVANDSEINRAMNRRVDIVILKKKYDYFEPGLKAPEQEE